MGLPVGQRDALCARLDGVRRISNDFGYGVGDDMDTLLAAAWERVGDCRWWKRKRPAV